MTTRTFQHSYFVDAPIAKIYDHLSDPNNYMGLSPLLISVTGIQWGTNQENQGFVRYQSVELFRLFGIISYHNPLNVLTTLTRPPQQMVTDVETRQNVSVRFTFDLQEHLSGTNITETISAQVPLLLSGFLVSQAKAVQQNRIKVLKQRMETGESKGRVSYSP